MDFISKIVSLGQTPTVFLSVFLICFIGYAIGAVKVKGLNLGTAGVFLFALLFGYLCTLPGLKDIPVLGKFYMADAGDAKISSFKFISNIGLVLFVASVGCIAGPKFFRNLKVNAKSYVPMGALIIVMGAAVTGGTGSSITGRARTPFPYKKAKAAPSTAPMSSAGSSRRYLLCVFF